MFTRDVVRKRAVTAVIVTCSLLASCSYKKSLPTRNEAMTFASPAAVSGAALSVSDASSSGGGGGSAQNLEMPTSRKIIRNATLELDVNDVSDATANVRTITERIGGYVEKLSQNDSGRRNAALTLRIPTARLDEAIAQIKGLATRTEHEEISTQDVTRNYIDLDARLRNAQAEEQQYLQILKRATTVKDTLDVTEKLGDVRGRVEELQGEMKYLTAQINMSAIQVSLHSEAETAVAGIHWRPLRQAKVAWSEMLSGLVDWADSVISFIINLPVYVAWLGSIAVLCVLAWKIVRSAWRTIAPRADWHWPWRRKTAENVKS